MKNRIIVITFITIIIVFGLVGARAFFHPGFYTSHDGEHQLVRQYVFDQGLKDGQIPVRFNRQLYNGYGYPLFVFTYRLPFYIGEIFRLSGFSFADSIKAVFLLSYIASGLTMFWFGRRWGNFAGLVATILYMWAPYRFSVMFVRAALGEHVAAVFVPLLFGSVFGDKSGRVKVVLGAVAIAGLFLSHAMMAQIVLLMFVPLLLTSLRASPSDGRSVAISSGLPRRYAPRNDGTVILRTLFMFALGLGLAAYYLIPAAAYRGLTQKLNPNYFADHFVTLRQLMYSPWGYTFSMKGTENDGMSFQVGAAQWAAVLLAAGYLFSVFGYRILVSRLSVSRFQTDKLKTDRLLAENGKPRTDNRVQMMVLILIFVLSIFLMTEKSAFVWNFWKNYINIDMPWRFLLMTTFAGSALAGVGFQGFQGLTFASAKVRPLVATLVATFLIGLAVYANRNHLRVNEYLDYPDSRLADYRGTSNSDNEYRPKWDDAGITRNFLSEAKISTGAGQLAVVRSKSNLLQVAGNFEEDSRVDLNILYFPGWEVLVDGQNWPFKYAGEGGIIRVDVPKGYHMIEAEYKETGLAKIGDGITLASLVLLTLQVQKTLKTRRTGDSDSLIV